MSNQYSPASLADIYEILGKFWKAFDAFQNSAQDDADKIGEKIDIWVRTNQSILESNQQLLTVIAMNAQEVCRSATSYEQGMNLLSQLQEQLRNCERLMLELNDTLVFAPPARVDQDAPPKQSNDTLQQLQQTSSKLNLLLQDWKDSLASLSSGPAISTTPPIEKTIKRDELITLLSSPKVAIPAISALVFLVGSGAAITLLVPKLIQPPLAAGTQRLTQENVELLKWATSREGKLAQNLLKWNNHKLSQMECLEDVKRLGVALTVDGKPATYGFCTIWVVSPEKRRFQRNE